MYKRVIYLIIFIFSFQILYAQTVLMNEQSPDTTYTPTRYGVNSEHFFHFYLGFAFSFGEEEVTKFGGTNQLTIGLRYKYKITNFFAIGSDIAYQRDRISFPTHQLVNKDYYKFYNFLSDFYIRFNFGRRGDIMGKFLDLGIYGTYTFYNLHHLDENTSPNTDYKKIIYEEHQVNYYDDLNYGFLARIGINQFVIFARYRYSLIRTDESYRDIPSWTIGLQISMHR